MKPDDHKPDLAGSQVHEKAPVTSELARMRLLAARVADATADFSGLEFEDILARASGALHSLAGGARLRVIREHELPADEPLTQGPVELPNGMQAFGSHYVGPPEPVRFLAYGLDSEPDTGLVLPLFFERLHRALQHAGFTAELALQSRRDWLTGLQWGPRLRDALLKLNPVWSSMALLVLKVPHPTAGGNSDESQLRLRQFAQSLRLALHDEDMAFQIERDIIAILTRERDLPRVEAALGRLAPDSRYSYAMSGEATGERLIDLALSRLTGRRPDRSAEGRPHAPSALHPVTVHAGTHTALAMLEQVAQEWLFRSPVSLILDLPTGYALEVLPSVNRPVLVVTDGGSRGYVHDLSDLEPDGLIFGGLDASEVRAQLERVVSGERVYSGPILDRSQLFPREREVWRLVARGLDNGEISRELGISERTVANYFTSLKDKLHLASRCVVALTYWGRFRED